MNKAIYTLKDFHVGDIVYLLPKNNMARGLDTTEQRISHIKTSPVTAVGRKYVTVGDDWNRTLFAPHDRYVGLKEVTSNNSPNYELFKSKEDAEDMLKREDNVIFLRNYRFDLLPGETLEEIRSLIRKSEENHHAE